MDEPIPLSSLTSFLKCHLCNGYLIEATTIIECLHTFCKSCIVRYLDDAYKCPECQILIHQSHPTSFIMADRTMQDIVYKLVPGLQEKERKRIEEFYKSRNLPIPDTETTTTVTTTSSENLQNGSDVCDELNDKGVDCNYHRDDTQVSILMQEAESLPPLEMKYLQCSIYTTIKSLKRYVSQKLYGSIDKHNTVDIFCQKELMGKDHTLEFVLCTRWRSKDLPLLLEYRPRVDAI